jgi:gliding motility-associated-like protein
MVDSLSVAGAIPELLSAVCQSSNSTELVSGGSRGLLQWQSSVDGVSYTNLSGFTDSVYKATNLGESTFFRVYSVNGVCAADTGIAVRVMVDSLSIPGKITSDLTSVCAEQNKTIIKISGSRGSIIWQSSSDGIIFNDIAGISDSIYTASNLINTTIYKAILKNGVCAAIESPTIQISVTPKSLPGEIVGAKDVCYGANATNLNLIGSRGVIQWQSSADNKLFTNLNGQTSTSFSVSDLKEDVFYRVVVKNNICADTISSPVKIAVNPLPLAPAATDVARCQSGSVQFNTDPAAGVITDWYGTAIGGNVLSGGNGTNTYTTPFLSASTTYFAQSRNLQTGCLSASRTPVVARVDALSVAGSITGAKEVCSGVNNTPLQLSGQRGDIQWQVSTDNILFNDIVGANQPVFSALDLTNSTFYRVKIKNGVCDVVNSAPIKMIVSQPSASGVITGMKAVCAEKNETVLKVAGTNGLIQWQSSINRTLFTDIPNENSDSLHTLNLLRTTYYRVVVKNGSCVSSASAEVTMTVNALPQAPVTQDGSRCGTGQIILRAFPPTGISNVIDWYLDSIPKNDLPIKVSSNIFVTPDVIGDIFYWAQTRNRVTGCVSKTRVAALAEIIPYAKTGTVSGDTIVCAGINQVGLKISGQEGRIQWQMSTDNINFSDIINAKTDSLTVFNLESTHYFRVLLNADNGCNPSIADTFRIVAPKPSFAGSINGVKEVCAGADSIQLNLTGFIGEIQWQSSADSLSFSDISLANDSILAINKLSQSTFYRVKLKSGICTPDTGEIVKIIVNELPIAPLSNDVINCNIGPVELNASVPIGITSDWYAVSTAGNILNRGKSTNTYLTDTLNSTVDYFVEARNLITGCLSSSRTKITALFDPAAIPVITGDPGLCNGDSIFLKADQNYGLQWFYNRDTLVGLNTQSIVVKKFGDYKVLFTNKSGCSNESETRTVLAYPDILGKLTIPSKTDICDGYPFLLSASGSYAYQWYKNGVKIQDSISSSFYTNSGGVYTVQYISDKGCKIMDPDSIKLRLIKSPDAKYTIGTTTCINIPVEFVNKSIVTESGNVIYKWEFGNGKTDTGFVMNHVYSKPGLYMTKLVVAPTSCLMLADTALMYVKIESPLPAIRYPAVNVVLNKPISLQSRDFGAKYLWSPPTGLTSTTIRNPETRLTQEQDYRIAITTSAGCTTTDSLLVRVFRENDIMVPEGFSPNADGQNDRLYPFLIGIKQMNMFRVYDRWGNLIFDNKQANSSTGWEGFYNGNPLPAGPYVWMAEGVDVDDKVIRRTGSVLLIR